MTPHRGAGINARSRAHGRARKPHPDRNGHGRTSSAQQHRSEPVAADSPAHPEPPPHEPVSTTVVVVDDGEVCRAPLVAHALRHTWDERGWLSDLDVSAVHLSAVPGAVCEDAASRLGLSYSLGNGTQPVLLEPVAAQSAGILLTVGRDQRTAVIRLAPGVQMKTFTCIEAAMLAESAVARMRTGDVEPPTDLPSLAHLLHSLRGLTPALSEALLSQPRDRSDPLALEPGHRGSKRQHRRSIELAYERGLALAALLRGAAGIPADA